MFRETEETSSQAPRCASWKAHKLRSSQASKTTSWQIDRLPGWKDNKRTEWQDVKMSRWQDDKMTGWQDDWMTRQEDDKTTRWQKLPNAAISCQLWQKCQNWQMLSNFAKYCQTLLNVANRYKKYPIIATRSQKLPKVSNWHWQKLTKIAKNWRMLDVAESWPK